MIESRDSLSYYDEDEKASLSAIEDSAKALMRAELRAMGFENK